MRAIVLRKTSFRDHDLIIQFFLEDSSRCGGFARGAQKSKKRFSHHFHPAGIYELEPQKNSSGSRWVEIKTCELMEWNPSLMTHSEGMLQWLTILEWILKEEEDSPHSFSDLVTLMKQLGSSTGWKAFHFFFIQQIKKHGFKPWLQHCIVCQKSGGTLFSFHEGGICHPWCGEGMPVSDLTLFFLKTSLESNEIPEQNSLQVKKELEAITLPFLEYQLGKKLKSRRFFESMNAVL